MMSFSIHNVAMLMLAFLLFQNVQVVYVGDIVLDRLVILKIYGIWVFVV